MKVKSKSLENVFIFTALFLAFSIWMYVDLPNDTMSLIFYMAVSFASVAFSWFAEQAGINNRKTTLKFFLLLSIGLLCVCFVFRNGTAIDDRHYRNMFSDIANIGPIRYFRQTFVEPAYICVLAIINKFTDDYLAVQIITGVIPFAIIAAGLIRMRNKLNIALSVFNFITAFYFQMVSTNLSRMFFAIAIVFYCMDYLFEEEDTKYIIGVIIASLFHFSALFMLLFLYLAKNKKIHAKRQYVIALFISMPLLFVAVAKFIAPLLGSRHGMYTTINSVDLIDGIVGCLDKLPFIFLFWYYKQDFPNGSQIKKNITLAQYIYSFSLTLDFSSMIVNLGRLSYYTELMYIIGISMLYKNMKSNLKKKVLLFFIVVYGFLSMYTSQFLLPSHAECLFPYQNVFFTIK